VGNLFPLPQASSTCIADEHPTVGSVNARGSSSTGNRQRHNLYLSCSHLFNLDFELPRCNRLWLFVYKSITPARLDLKLAHIYQITLSLIMDLPANFDILSIPGFFLMAFLPHSYAVHVASGGNPLAWDNRNPRSAELKSNLKSRLAPENWALYQRAEAASANAYENFPFYAAAIIVGRIAGLSQDTSNKFAVGFLAARALHSLSFILTSNQKYTIIRTLAYFASIVLGTRHFLRAAKALN
jgi:uncharacterized MAPEG superfamily protein